MTRYRAVLLAGLDNILRREGLLQLLPVTSIIVEARDEKEAAEFAARALGLPDDHSFAYVTKED
jgi:hypothetical protein